MKSHRRTKRLPILVCLTSLIAFSNGCMYASLASSTGPRRPGEHWSMAKHQMVHAGEEVDFDFVLLGTFRGFLHPLGIADYCVTLWGGERIEASADAHGHFQFSLPFDGLRAGDRVEVVTTAFRQRGGRDFMKVGGRWMQSESPYEIADSRVAADSIIFTVYETTIELPLVTPPIALDAETGVLRIGKSNGAVTSVYVDKPDRPGFRLIESAEDGGFRVSYVPRGNELDPAGTTSVEFTVYDVSGQRHSSSAVLDTP